MLFILLSSKLPAQEILTQKKEQVHNHRNQTKEIGLLVKSGQILFGLAIYVADKHLHIHHFFRKQIRRRIMIITARTERKLAHGQPSARNGNHGLGLKNDII